MFCLSCAELFHEFVVVCDSSKQEICETYHVRLTCERLSVDERYREGWIATMGEGRLDVLERFERVWQGRDWRDDMVEKWLASVAE